MTITRYVVIRPNGKLYQSYGRGIEMFFRDKEAAEKVAVSWGKVKEVKIEIPIE